jgi:signal transduction histidine kinase
MLNISLIATLLVCLALCVLGGFVFAGSRRSIAKNSFTLLCVALVVWVAANYLADTDIERSLLWTRLTFFAVVMATAFFLVFVRNFPRPRETPLLNYVVFTTTVGIIGVMVWAPEFIPGVTMSDGTSNVAYGPLYIVFLVYFALCVCGVILQMVRSMRRERGMERERLKVVLIAALLLVAMSSFTNLILPLVTGDNPLARYGMYSALLFAGVITYAIIRQRLFNLRLVTARAITYVLTLGTLAVGFVTLSFLVVDNLWGGQQAQGGQRALLVGFLLLAVLGYQPLKSFFDTLTRKVFFHDLYDVRAVLGRLGDIAYRSPSSSHSLLLRSIQVLDDVLHPVFVLAYARTVEDNELRLVSYVGKRPQGVQTNLLEKLPRRNVVVVEEELQDGGHAFLYDALQSTNIAAVLNLRPAGEDVGYILLGYKLNGAMYNDQDLTLLSMATDSMAVGVQNMLRFEKINHFNETLQQQVRDATAELRDSNNKLKSLDEAKDEFISMASHQLRTPLTSVKGYISMVLEGDAGELNPTQHQLLEQAFASSQRMVYLISDFLNVSRLQTGKFTIERTPVLLSTVVEQEVGQLRNTAESRNLKLECSVPSSLPIMQLDESKLRQTIMNFVDNAIFYSRPGGTIKVDLIKTAKELVLTVQDWGIGVPVRERHRLFTKFYRASNARAVRPDGTGVGLFMAKKAIVAHGGSIIFESVEGKGSTFGFRLPLQQSLAKDHPDKLKQ